MGKKGPKSVNIIDKSRMGSAMQNGVNPPMLDSQGVPMAPSSPAKIVPVIAGAAIRWGLGRLVTSQIARQGARWLTGQGLKKFGKNRFKNMAGQFAKGPTGKNWMGKVMKFGEGSILRPFQSVAGALPKGIQPFASNAGRIADYASWGYGVNQAYNAFGSDSDNTTTNLDNTNTDTDDKKLNTNTDTDDKKLNTNTNTSTDTSTGTSTGTGDNTTTPSTNNTSVENKVTKPKTYGARYDNTILAGKTIRNNIPTSSNTKSVVSNTKNVVKGENKIKASESPWSGGTFDPYGDSDPFDTSRGGSANYIPHADPINKKQIRANKQYRKDVVGMDKKDIKTAKLEEKMNISGDGLGGRIKTNRVINRYDRGMKAQVNVSPENKPRELPGKAVIGDLKQQDVVKFDVKPDSKVDISSLKPRGTLQTVEQANKAQDELDLKGVTYMPTPVTYRAKRRG